MHFCQPPSGGFEIGFSQARGLESIDKPHKWGSGIKIRLYQPRREECVSKVEDATGFSRVEIQLEPNLIAER